uniref:Uncharacterized protein n=1 Tax=Equus asinus TaxID=9793 RepID=A0A8C4N7T8_EQUAS
MKQQRRQLSLINIMHQVLSVGQPSFLYNPEQYFINYFGNASFVIAPETCLRRESHCIPFMKSKCTVKSFAGCLFFGTARRWDTDFQEALPDLSDSLTCHRGIYMLKTMNKFKCLCTDPQKNP